MFDVWLCSEKKFQKIGMWDQKREEKREGRRRRISTDWSSERVLFLLY